MENIDGHWHIIGGQLYQTLDIEGNVGNMNKNISGIVQHDLEVDQRLRTVKYFLGGNDTLFNYKMIEDTLIIRSVNFNEEYKAIKIEGCKPVNDWFYTSSMQVEIAKSDVFFGQNVRKRSLALELLISEVDGVVKFSTWDKESDDRSDLEKAHSRMISSIPKQMIDDIFVDLYVDRNINIKELAWILDALNEIGFYKIYIVFEVSQPENLVYQKIEFNLTDVENITVEEFIEKKKKVHHK